MTPPPDDRDRQEILRRRAFLISSALGALGCASQEPPTAAGQAPSTAATLAAAPAVNVPAPSSAPPPTATPDAAAPPRLDAGAAEELPPLEVPSGASEAARGHYEDLAREVPALRGRLDELERQLPSCSIDAASCDKGWRAAAEELWSLEQAIGELGPRCGGSSGDAQAFADRLAAHRKQLESRRAALAQRLEATLGSQAQRDRWQQHQAAARQANPRPCLRYACPDW